MSELSFDELLEESFKTVHTGEVVTGKVIEVKDDEIILNIGCKADGIISKHEYSNDASIDLKETVHVDDEMEAKVLKVNDSEGQILLSYKRLAQDRVNKRLEEAFENEEVLKAVVTQVVSGGLTVNVEGSRVFIPASLVSDVFERNLEKYNGQEIEFVITEFNPRKRRIIGNRKKIIAERKAALKEELFARIEEGMTVTGTVTNLTDFGAFIDLGGADGLLHVSEMSWGRIERPKNVFKVGDEVTCFIKEIKGDKIALSMKFPGENPWEKAAVKYAPGTIVTGKIARMTDFGAFIELEEGIDALLHVSQISRTRVEKPSDVLKVGDIIEAKVVDFNAETKRISLSKKALEPAPERAPRTSSPRRKKEEVSNDFTDKVEANTLGSMIAAAMGEEIPAEEPAVEETAAAVEEAAPEVTED
ncbi:MAG: 30S ribosomal protein S1 [Lachnospiraceae bacterium]|nr:30S ribosomal protein S1 [Lachnospiraceae bacterium]